MISDSERDDTQSITQSVSQCPDVEMIDESESEADGKSLCTDSQCASCYLSSQFTESETESDRAFIVKDYETETDGSYVPESEYETETDAESELSLTQSSIFTDRD